MTKDRVAGILENVILFAATLTFKHSQCLIETVILTFKHNQCLTETIILTFKHNQCFIETVVLRIQLQGFKVVKVYFDCSSSIGE